MRTKLFEVRDAGTFIPCIGISTDLNDIDAPVTEEERYLIRRCGYGDRCIIFGRLDGSDFSHDPYNRKANPRTLQVAHAYVEENWDLLDSGQVICVETILGERETPKTSERLETL